MIMNTNQIGPDQVFKRRHTLWRELMTQGRETGLRKWMLNVQVEFGHIRGMHHSSTCLVS